MYITTRCYNFVCIMINNLNYYMLLFTREKKNEKINIHLQQISLYPIKCF